MKSTDLESSSLWLDGQRAKHDTLKADATCDVVVVGAGITGLTTGYLLKQAGKSVIIFDKGRVAGGESGHTTAHLTCVLDTRLSELRKHFGEDGAKLAWQAGITAIDGIERIVRDEGIECNFQRVPGYLHAPIAQQDFSEDSFRAEAELAKQLGFQAEFVAAVPIFDRPGLQVPDQALFHPVAYLSQLAAKISGDGCSIFESSETTEIVADPLSVKVNGKIVRCKKLVVATHAPLVGLGGVLGASLFQTKLAGYSTYALSGSLPHGTLPSASFWDTDNPYYYLRIDRTKNGTGFVFGGEDHKTGQHEDAQSHYASLEAQLKTFLPDAPVDHRWSGQVIETHDGLPYIGETSEHQFSATGFAGNGMTFGTLAGMMARDWVLGRSNPWAALFGPDRKPVHGGLWDYVKENVDYPYHLVKGFLTSGERESVDTVRNGEGRVLKIDGKRCAVYRDQNGRLSIRSAICTHMGCVVRWNDAEKTWDCPCHGSRFNTDGKVIAGPAETPLAKHEPANSSGQAGG